MLSINLMLRSVLLGDRHVLSYLRDAHMFHIYSRIRINMYRNLAINCRHFLPTSSCLINLEIQAVPESNSLKILQYFSGKLWLCLPMTELGKLYTYVWDKLAGELDTEWNVPNFLEICVYVFKCNVFWP